MSDWKPTNPTVLRNAVCAQWNDIVGVSSEHQTYNLRLIRFNYPHEVSVPTESLNGRIDPISEWCGERFGPDPLIYRDDCRLTEWSPQSTKFRDPMVFGSFILVIARDPLASQVASSIRIDLFGFFRDPDHAFEFKVRWG